ncbi:MAG: hypothetical protein RJA45_627 [Actinomycetota bacterium]
MLKDFITTYNRNYATNGISTNRMFNLDESVTNGFSPFLLVIRTQDDRYRVDVLARNFD